MTTSSIPSILELDELCTLHEKYTVLHQHIRTYGIDRTTYTLAYNDLLRLQTLRLPSLESYTYSPIDGAFTKSTMIGIEGFLGDLWDGLWNFISNLFTAIFDFFSGLLGGGSSGGGGGGGSLEKKADKAQKAAASASDKVHNRKNGGVKRDVLEHLQILPIDKIKAEYTEMRRIIGKINQSIQQTERQMTSTNYLTRQSIQSIVKGYKHGVDEWKQRYRKLQQDMIPFKMIASQGDRVVAYLDDVEQIVEQEHKEMFKEWSNVRQAYKSFKDLLDVYFKKTKKDANNTNEYQHFSCIASIVSWTIKVLNAIYHHCVSLLDHITKSADKIGKNWIDSPIGTESIDLRSFYNSLTGASYV